MAFCPNLFSKECDKIVYRSQGLLCENETVNRRKVNPQPSGKPQTLNWMSVTWLTLGFCHIINKVSPVYMVGHTGR